jgi:hypothetical protein
VKFFVAAYLAENYRRAQFVVTIGGSKTNLESESNHPCMWCYGMTSDEEEEECHNIVIEVVDYIPLCWHYSMPSLLLYSSSTDVMPSLDHLVLGGEDSEYPEHIIQVLEPMVTYQHHHGYDPCMWHQTQISNPCRNEKKK